MLQRVAACYSVLQSITVCCSLLQCFDEWARQHLIRKQGDLLGLFVAECCSVLQCGAVCCSVCAAVCRVLQCVAECCSVLQCVTVRCSVLMNGLKSTSFASKKTSLVCV